jgi:hypothetical protein
VRCEACGTENFEGMARCSNCGAAVPTTVVTAPSRSSDARGIPAMCPQCGANGCTSNPSCELCGGVLAGGAALPAPVEGVHWVQLRLEVECVFCRTRSPVGHLDEGRFFCFSCARELPYLAGFWQKRLQYASAGGDCFWSRFGRFPAWQWPSGEMADHELTALMRLLRELGGDRQKIFAEGSPTHSLGDPISNKQKLVMAPGHPLCDSCHTPLTASFGARGAVTMSCSRCGSHKGYQAGAAALAACEEVIAVVAPDHVYGAKSVGLQRAPQSAAVAITCPKCGAALQLAPGERLAICRYCSTESIVPLGVMAQALGSAPGEQPIWLALRSPAKLRREYAKAAQAEAQSALRVAVNNAAVEEPALIPATVPLAPRRSKMPLLLLVALAVPIVAVVVYLHNQQAREDAARARRARRAAVPASVAALQRFSFAMSSSEAAKLFGKEERAGSVSVNDSAVGWLHIGYSIQYSVNLSSSHLVDFDAVSARLNKLVPNRLEKRWGRWGIHVARSQLELERDGIRVSSEDRQLADALWAVARYGLFAKPKPSAAQLQRVKGPSLSKLRELDLAVPIESAASASKKLFTDSWCWRRTNPQSKQDELNCTVDIANPWFSEFSLTWPNSASARPVGGFFLIADRDNDGAAATVSACLDRAFGPGKQQVLDHASGSGWRIWSLDNAGDHVTLDRDTVHIESAAGHNPTKPSSWSGAFAALVDALVACKRK